MQNGLRKRVYDMEAQELRIGNIVRLQDHFVGGNAMVTGITCDRLTAVNSVGTNIDTINIMYVEPIPITEELLLKIGFKKDVDANSLYRYAIDNCLFEIRLWESGTFIKLENYCEDCVRKVHLPKTPNLHQLQNAYYMVTGKELEIKL